MTIVMPKICVLIFQIKMDGISLKETKNVILKERETDPSKANPAIIFKPPPPPPLPPPSTST